MGNCTPQSHGRQYPTDESATTPARGLTTQETDQILADTHREIFAELDRQKLIRRYLNLPLAQIRQLPANLQLEVLHARVADLERRLKEASR